MQDIQLTSEEKKELEKRGFYVKEYISFLEILRTIPIIALIATGFSFFGFVFSAFFMHLTWILFCLLVGLTLILFTISGRAFYFKEKVFVCGKTFSSLKKSSIARYVTYISSHYKNQLEINGIKLDLTGLLFLMIISPMFYQAFLEGYYILLCLPFVFFICIYLLNICINTFHPLYAFGNLGQKIQSLTPRISEQGKHIESEFRGDMDFRVLSKSFDSLASAFSDIVVLVIKLEKVEQKANRGNLFDSDKYINSLREDIRSPLLSLKTFLEKKKVELQNSQQELMRVRVSVGGEGESRELQSIRSNELLKELDENIGKLDVMLEKI